MRHQSTKSFGVTEIPLVWEQGIKVREDKRKSLGMLPRNRQPNISMDSNIVYGAHCLWSTILTLFRIAKKFVCQSTYYLFSLPLSFVQILQTSKHGWNLLVSGRYRCNQEQQNFQTEHTTDSHQHKPVMTNTNTSQHHYKREFMIKSKICTCKTAT